MGRPWVVFLILGILIFLFLPWATFPAWGQASILYVSDAIGSDATGTLIAQDASGKEIPGVRAIAAWMPEDRKKTRFEVGIATGTCRDVFVFATNSRSNGVRLGSSVDVDRPVARGEDVVVNWEASPEWLQWRAVEIVLEDAEGRLRAQFSRSLGDFENLSQNLIIRVHQHRAAPGAPLGSGNPQDVRDSPTGRPRPPTVQSPSGTRPSL